MIHSYIDTSMQFRHALSAHRRTMVHNTHTIAPWILAVNPAILESSAIHANNPTLVKMLKSDPKAKSYSVYPPLMFKDFSNLPEDLFFSDILVNVSSSFLSPSLYLTQSVCRCSRQIFTAQVLSRTRMQSRKVVSSQRRCVGA